MDQAKRTLYNNLGIEFVVTNALYFNTACTTCLLKLELDLPLTPQSLCYQEANAQLIGCA